MGRVRQHRAWQVIHIPFCECNAYTATVLPMSGQFFVVSNFKRLSGIDQCIAYTKTLRLWSYYCHIQLHILACNLGPSSS